MGTELVYAQARYYNADTKVFLSSDPYSWDSFTNQNYLLNPAMHNTYGYANNSPMKYVDPDGRYAESALDAAFIAKDIKDISEARKSGNKSDLIWSSVALVGDLIGAAAPGATGVGFAVKTVGKKTVEVGGRVVVNGIETTKEVAEWLSKGSQKTDVYIGVKEGKDVYVGISKDVSKREAQHGARFDELQKVFDMKTKNQARAVEQVIIDSKKGIYQNTINSISSKRDIYILEPQNGQINIYKQIISLHRSRNLKKMNIKKVEYIWQDLKKTNFYSQNIEDVESFKFWNCKNLDLDFLKKAKKLKSLEVLNFPGEDFLALSELDNLEKLKIVHIPSLKNLKGLDNLKKLSVLEISTSPSWDSQKRFFKIDGIEEIYNLNNLHDLTLSGWEIKKFNKEEILKKKSKTKKLEFLEKKI